MISESNAIITVFADEARDFWKQKSNPAQFEEEGLASSAAMPTLMLNKAASLQVGQLASKFAGISGF